MIQIVDDEDWRRDRKSWTPIPNNDINLNVGVTVSWCTFKNEAFSSRSEKSLLRFTTLKYLKESKEHEFN